MNIEYVKLDPSTLEPSSTGLLYKKTIMNSGGVELQHVHENSIRLSFDSTSNKLIASVIDYLGNPVSTFSDQITFTYANTSTSVTAINGLSTLNLSNSIGGDIEINAISETIGSSNIKVTIMNLSYTKVQKINELKQAYANSFITFQSSALGSVKTYPADVEAQKNFQYYTQLLLLDPNEDTIDFKTIEDGTLVSHTRTQFLQLLKDFRTFDVNKTKQFNAYESQINSATDISTLQVMTFTFS